jgi:cyclic-di-AMP phosphodiesterase PgpH
MFPFHSHSPAFALAMVAFAAAIFLALMPINSAGLRVEEGGIATRTIRAPSEISFVSESLTERRQDEAAQAVPETLIFDPSIAAAQQQKLSDLIVRIRTIITENDQPLARTSQLERLPDLNLSPGSISILRDIHPADLVAIETEALRTLGRIFDQSLPQTGVSDMRERASTYVNPSLGRDLSTLISELIRPFIVTNQAVDQARTQAERSAARAGIAPVRVSYAENQIIVEEGAPITPEAREALLNSGVIATGTWQWQQIAASLLVAIVTAAAVGAGVHAFRPNVTIRELLVIALAVAIPVFVLKLYLPFILPDENRHFLAFVLPVAAAGMVLAGFVGVAVALLAAMLIALLATFATVLLLDISIVGIAGTLDVVRIALACGLGGAAGVFAVRNAERIVQFLLGGLLVGVSLMAVLLATWLIDPGRELRDLPWMAFAAGVNGGLSAFLAAGIFVTLGSLFGITTRLQLLEMSQLSQPLLLRLQDEAPSTFQHSVIVANLAEKGAFVIGADGLLARVGCYYHDIGKLARPGFFIENQMGGANPHDALDPADSARIISDHVTDGLNLAAQYKVPAKVAQFIPEHHGTRMVAYFYRRAAEEDPDVDIDAFRYPGPKPQSRETAISMLADSCEAAVRSSPDHSHETIDRIVDEVFNERLTEGQLDESDLTLNNIRALAASFKATLRAVYHPRVEYPAPTEVEMLLRRLPFRRVNEPTPSEKS